MSDEGRGLTKWQLALVVGTGAAAVAGLSLLAYVALRSSSSREEGVDSDPPPVDNPGAQAKVTEPASKVSVVLGQPPMMPHACACMGRTSCCGVVHDFPTPCYSQSALEQALELKQQGNSFFKQKKYEDAISRYKEGISLCPSDKKEEIAKFYQNIAAVYHMMVS